ncbi:MAG: hypothetical protein ACYC9Y_00175 [Candidatus Methylomirabilia bacterium]
MNEHPERKRYFSRSTALAWLVVAAGIVGTLISAGCGEITTTSVEPEAAEKGAVSLKIKPAATSVAPGKTLDISVTASDANGSPVPDGTMIYLENDHLGVVNPTSAPTVKGTAHVKFTAGATKGSAKIKATFGGVSRTVTVLIDTNAAPPPPSDEPIDLSKVIWVHGRGQNIASWPVTARLGSVAIRMPNVCSSGMSWPSSWTKIGAKNVNANHIVLANINGRWYGGAWEALNAGIASCRPMETITKNQPQYGPFGQVEQDPFWTWHPKKGEKIGFMITSWIRSGVLQPVGRSNVVMTEWPY